MSGHVPRRAACQRCGWVRQVNESRPIPPLCADCKAVTGAGPKPGRKPKVRAA